MTSTIDALKNIIDGKPAVATTRLGGPDAPYRREQAAKKKAEEDALLEQAASRKAEYMSLLRIGTWIIEFTKVDGTSSIMECTLDERLLPPASNDPKGHGRAPSAHLLHVYALDRDPPGWRSCKVLNITRIYAKPQDI